MVERESTSSGNRAQMIAGAAELIRMRGVTATSMRDVVAHTGTPRGSLSHYFPAGKAELAREAVLHASQEVESALTQALDSKGPLGGLRSFLALWRRVLVDSHYTAGCAVLSVAIEEQPGNLGSDNSSAPRPVRAADEAFSRWEELLRDSLTNGGVPPARARRLAALTVSAVEGTVAMCRARQDASPLDDVGAELLEAYAQALGHFSQP